MIKTDSRIIVDQGDVDDGRDTDDEPEEEHHRRLSGIIHFIRDHHLVEKYEFIVKR